MRSVELCLDNVMVIFLSLMNEASDEKRKFGENDTFPDEKGLECSLLK